MDSSLNPRQVWLVRSPAIITATKAAGFEYLLVSPSAEQPLPTDPLIPLEFAILKAHGAPSSGLQPCRPGEVHVSIAGLLFYLTDFAVVDREAKIPESILALIISSSKSGMLDASVLPSTWKLLPQYGERQISPNAASDRTNQAPLLEGSSTRHLPREEVVLPLDFYEICSPAARFHINNPLSWYVNPSQPSASRRLAKDIVRGLEEAMEFETPKTAKDVMAHDLCEVRRLGRVLEPYLNLKAYVAATLRFREVTFTRDIQRSFKEVDEGQWYPEFNL